MARARSVSSQSVVLLDAGWTMRLASPGAIADPVALVAATSPAIPATVPGTALAAVHASGNTALAHQSADDFDVWYTCQFEPEEGCLEELTRTCLRFDGLATIADVWLNGAHLFHSENMFLRHEPDVSAQLKPGANVITIRFASLNRFLEDRRPRPKWRTHLVDHPQLRWIRTTLLGRMPGWHHNARQIHAVGPWKPVSIVTDTVVRLKSADIQPHLDGKSQASVAARLQLDSLTDAVINGATLHVGEDSIPLDVATPQDGGFSLTGDLRLNSVELWWPHTHGEQPMYPVSVEIRVDNKTIVLDFGLTGFRTVALDIDAAKFSISINEQPVFFRGACWTTAAATRLAAAPAAYDVPLSLAADAGMNVLRLPGTGFYEVDAFYDGCAARGISIWQDFAFGLMDYPDDDPAFHATVAEEVRQLLDRLQLNPALTILCGNSECAATAAMHGLTADAWKNRLFDVLLPEIASKYCADVPYVPSSEWGGALPFHVNAGASYYYGVGAYLKPLEDARRSDVRFATECLAFANIPEDEAIDRFLATGESPGQHPSWKAGVPRDVSLGWDFDDVRDHYVRTLMGEDPAAARFSDRDRYLALGRVASGEAMLATFTEWRRAVSLCKGGIVLQFQDLWPGAGWGILDSSGRPKSVYYYLKRALSPLSVFFSDEGMNGLLLHVVNDTPRSVQAILRVAFYRSGQTRVGEYRTNVNVGPNSSSELSVDALAGTFLDTAYAYRFGPPTQDVTVAALESVSNGRLLAPSAFFFPVGRKFPGTNDVGLAARARRRSAGGGYEVIISAMRFAQAVTIDARGFDISDNYFHIEPDKCVRVELIARSETAGKTLSGTIGALNCLSRTKIALDPD